MSPRATIGHLLFIAALAGAPAARGATASTEPPVEVTINAPSNEVVLAWADGTTVELPFSQVQQFEMAPEVDEITPVLVLVADDGRRWVVARGEKSQFVRFSTTTVAQRPLIVCQSADCGAGVEGPKPDFKLQTSSLDLDLPSPVSAGALAINQRMPTSVTGGPIVQIPAKVVDAAVSARQDALLACYQRGLSRNSKLAGEVTVEMMVQADGSVSEAHVDASTLGNREVEDCVVVEFRQLSLPPPKEGTFAIIKHTVRFNKK